MKKDVFQLNRQFREELLRREYKATRNVLRSYERAWKSISRDLDALTRRIEQAIANGDDISPSWFYREARMRTLLDEINSRYQQLAKECTEFTQTAVKVAAPMGARHAYQLGKNAVVGEFAGLPSAAVESMTGLFSVGPVRELFAKLGPIAMREASRVLIDAMAKGENPRKAAKLLRDSIEGLTKQRAVLIARTEIIRSYRMAAQATFQKNADVLSGWRWTAAKTRATCPVCLAMDGEVFPVTETLSSHPACRCAMVPVPMLDFGGPKPETGEEWFAKQPAFIQDRTLGSKTKGQMLRSGVFSLKDIVQRTHSPTWGSSYRSRTIKELQMLARNGRLRLDLVNPPPLSGFVPQVTSVVPAAPIAPALPPAAKGAANVVDGPDWTERTARLYGTKTPLDDILVNGKLYDHALDTATSNIFGKPLDKSEIVELLGIPKAQSVEIRVVNSLIDLGEPGTGSTINVAAWSDEGGKEAWHMTRAISTDRTGSIIVKHDSFEIAKDATGSVRPGDGAVIFARSIENYRKAGVDAINVVAAGSPESRTMNGYYTWARFGFDGGVKPLQQAQFAKVFGITPKTIHDIMSRPGGAAWWKEYGHGFVGSFDLAEGSVSSKILNEYVARRRLK